MIIIFVIVIVSTFVFINYYSNKALPLLMSYAEAEAKKLIILVINKAVTKQINNVDTTDIFEITYNNAGEVILVDFNSKRTSIALSTITSLVEINLRAIEEGKIDMIELPDNSLDVFDTDLLEKGIILEVPLGVVSNSALLTNIGPKIPVKISFLENVDASVDLTDFMSKLDDLITPFRFVILTSRTQFFSSEDEEPSRTNILNMGRDKGCYTYYKFYISPFSQEDVQEFLHNKYNNRKQRKKAKKNISPQLYPRASNLTKRF